MKITPSTLLIDLISNQHKRLRQTIVQRWQAECGVYFSASEWYLLSTIAETSHTISQAAQNIGISRQAMQKSVKRLVELGVISAEFRNGNKRDKYLQLTHLGKDYYKRYIKLKQTLEQELIIQWGVENTEKLRNLFSPSKYL